MKAILILLSLFAVHRFASSYQMPRIIQGGMGIRISSWQLAREVSRQGELGVVSGTGIDTVIIRELQTGKNVRSAVGTSEL